MNIIGHGDILRRLTTILSKNAAHSAYLFTGPEAVGKFLIASCFADALINARPSLSMPDDHAKHFVSDLIVLGRTDERVEKKKKEKRRRTEIGIEEIRQAQKHLALFPFSGRRNVLLIDQAQSLTRGAQNALLKTLEEPRAESVILLVTHNPQALLPTVRSRCQKITFNLVDEKEIRAYLPADAPQEVALYAAGRPGVALRLCADPASLDRITAMERDYAVCRGGMMHERFAIAQRLSDDVRAAHETLSLWLRMERRHFYATTDERNDSFDRFVSNGQRIMAAMTILHTTNANVRVILEQLMLDLEDWK